MTHSMGRLFTITILSLKITSGRNSPVSYDGICLWVGVNDKPRSLTFRGRCFLPCTVMVPRMFRAHQIQENK